MCYEYRLDGPAAPMVTDGSMARLPSAPTRFPGLYLLGNPTMPFLVFQKSVRKSVEAAAWAVSSLAARRPIRLFVSLLAAQHRLCAAPYLSWSLMPEELVHTLHGHRVGVDDDGQVEVRGEQLHQLQFRPHLP
jgi:hypothetical protein